ncbi:unnamed protein product [Gemmata massiliana]|uniref:Uncharacterized protein n=1 Tax=Gemmata massiliana TaxID=1210884 RepID=A0A6P2CV66_9BACT|nr:hypothetical protein [Gemmata massiliana]VTR91594.1 unnamed protein product [Gemmata massiliana]
MDKRCVGCGGQLESGTIRARNMGQAVHSGPQPGVIVSTFAFVRPGTPTSGNPVKAFLQGLHEEPGDQLFALEAYRCAQCGRVEFYTSLA